MRSCCCSAVRASVAACSVHAVPCRVLIVRLVAHICCVFVSASSRCYCCVRLSVCPCVSVCLSVRLRRLSCLQDRLCRPRILLLLLPKVACCSREVCGSWIQILTGLTVSLLTCCTDFCCYSKPVCDCANKLIGSVVLGEPWHPTRRNSVLMKLANKPKGILEYFVAFYESNPRASQSNYLSVSGLSVYTIF